MSEWAKRAKYKKRDFDWVTINHARKLGRVMGGRFLDSKFEGIQRPHTWECEHGHKFNRRYSNIYWNGNWCPECRKGQNLEDLDSNNPNNWYSENKKKAQHGMKYDKKGPDKEYLIKKINERFGTKLVFVGDKVSKFENGVFYVSNGIGVNTIIDIMKRNYKKLNPQELEKFIRSL